MDESLRALIVEDDLYMRMLLRSLLLSLGVKDVSEAKNGGIALSILADRDFDFILSDLTMMPMDGIEFTRAVRQSGKVVNPFIPIIMVTSHTERQHVEAARDAGVTEFLAKPVTINNLTMRISEIVERPRQFVQTPNYFGPDRRRRNEENYTGPRRRSSDAAETDSAEADPDPAVKPGT